MSTQNSRNLEKLEEKLTKCLYQRDLGNIFIASLYKKRVDTHEDLGPFSYGKCEEALKAKPCHEKKNKIAINGLMEISFLTWDASTSSFLYFKHISLLNGQKSWKFMITTTRHKKPPIIPLLLLFNRQAATKQKQERATSSCNNAHCHSHSNV